ncbi:MAG: UDP-N-acetylglucosamine transferase subunit ALG13 [Chlamydiales bacterium]
MIFLTIGTQMAFDRLVECVDGWAAGRPDVRVFAQIGDSALSPEHIEARGFISPQEYAEHMREASVVIAHAGLGSIISALENGKPIIVLPRRAEMGEHRNDHQLATARRFEAHDGVFVAFTTEDLIDRLGRLESITAPDVLRQDAAPELLDAIRAFIQERGD